MKIVLTGTHGQMARALAERGANLPAFEIVCAGRPHLDLARPQTIARIIAAAKPDLVISAAAYTAVDAAEDEIELAHTVNAVAPGILAAAAASINARIIHLSTDYVYPGDKPDPYVESDATGPCNVYGRTKLAGEEAVRAQNAAHLIMRTSWICSPFGRNFVKTVIQKAADGSPLRIVNDQFGNPTSASDVADAILQIAEFWRREPARGLGEVYHCANAGTATWWDVGRHALAISRDRGGPFVEVSPIKTQEWPTKARRPQNSQA